MKWIGKKKKKSMKKPTSSMASSAASSSHSSFTKSWISKFKQIRDKPKTTTVHNHQTNFYRENTATTDPEKLMKPNPYSNPTCSPLLPVSSMFEQQHEILFIRNGHADNAGYIDNLPFGFQRMSVKDDDGGGCRSRELSGWGRSQTNRGDDYKLYGKASIKSNGRPVEEEKELLNNNKKKKREEDHRSPRFITPTSVCLRNKTPTTTRRDDNHLPTYDDQVTSTITTPELREFFKSSPVSSIHDYQNSASLHMRSNHFQVKGRYEKSPRHDDVARSMSNRNFLHATVRNSKDKKVEEEEAAATEWKRLKNAKLHEYNSRKSVYIQGEGGWSDSNPPKQQQKQGNLHFKVGRTCSPRILTKKEAVCRIKPLEDMKKAAAAAAQTRNKKKQIENGKRDNTSVSQEMENIGRVIGRVDHQLESCAEAKTSVNPGEDFKASMMEMIAERGIRGPQELEELLACYLALNSDEYHDVIIRVFRQVWSELDGMKLTVLSSRG